ncbi:Zn-dependent hydrolase, glyoxylase [Caulobacter sp. AP07]|uniref:MBL fold metallo-hydrolase n=1 Tax=Caulobacter sp. AP07 TaxID=1144304 RepID=UPI0002721188|nr:MBL fold metallo-hydrolase [Caulobacter sp. AP07]EJL27378.1 Zn-dependent hydrolase, glyoxylase [Caulobacter sp. AP07]
MLKTMLAVAAMSIAALGAGATQAAGTGRLDIEVYNPGADGVFPVSSEIISGKTEVILIDAQFQRRDAEALVSKIRASGKTLTAVYISQSDPDYYFGLDTIIAAFPGAKVLATPQTVAQIKATKDGKLAYWGPVLKDQAPKTIIVPQPLETDTLKVDGEALRIMGLDGPAPDRTYVWVPSRKAVVGGVLVAANGHVWMADTQTVASRGHWLDSLDHILALKPSMVVPGHYLPNPDGSQPFTVKSVAFTRDYLKAFEIEAAKAPDSVALIAAMKARYPDLPRDGSLELTAKVIKGEMKWPAEDPKGAAPASKTVEAEPHSP